MLMQGYSAMRPTVPLGTDFLKLIFVKVFDTFLTIFLMAPFAVDQSEYKFLWESESTVVGKTTGAWQQRFPQLSHFDWLVSAKSHQKIVKKDVVKLSQTNQKLTLPKRQRYDAQYSKC